MPHPKGGSGSIFQRATGRGPASAQSRVISVTSRQPSGGGGGGQNFQALFDAFQKQQSQFNQRAESRFADVNRRSDLTRKRALAANKQALQEARRVGKSQKLELRRRATKAQASSQQSLASRGLGNTTIVESQQRAIEGDFARQSRAVDEDISRRRVGVLENRAGLEAGLGELGINTSLSRRDQAPNISQTLQLLQQLGGGF